MSDFDVEKEAERFTKAKGMGMPTIPEMVPHSFYGQVHDLLTRCRDATEEADIKAVCPEYCGRGCPPTPPTRMGGSAAVYEHVMENTGYCVRCSATGIHEHCRQREGQG